MKDIFDFIVKHYQEAIAGTLGLYEFIVRIWPTVKNYSLVSKIIYLVKKIDEFLNITKKTK